MQGNDRHGGKRWSNKGGAQVIMEYKYLFWITSVHRAKMAWSDALMIIGGFTLIFYSIKAAWKCYQGFKEFILSEFWQVDLRTYGQWAVVTGATSGIGKAYAMELAQRGLDIVLVSRCDVKLRQVAKEIESQHGRKTRIIRVDFTHGHNIYPYIATQLQGLEIGILVNNVAMPYSDDFAPFLEIPDAEQKITEILDCNALSVAQTTRLVLPGMLERRTGLIVNISSQMGMRPQPLLALYSATKVQSYLDQVWLQLSVFCAGCFLLIPSVVFFFLFFFLQAFVMYFSQCLHAEYKAEGITVQCVVPFLVSTNMNKMKSSSCVKSAAAFAREALNTVGYSNYTSGCLLHALQSFAIGVLMPDRLRMSSFLVAKLLRAAHQRKVQRVCRGIHTNS
ncbi:hydroxysteroid (20-beta) dehydrogenase 2 isoform X1 [Syngnathus acus]|uniref:hydroxysteroid (20-beta) dehydrogenase 2 isoform X1 n=1 Tax=Syngnathus acus TaxID=161584 RepID=UPI0018860D39|nr:hydroxysteroid (20-beta) dehydrogenase 2 isoform X1 [Syngnathus acus]